MSQQITPERKATYYLGMVLIIVGVITIIISMISFMNSFGNHTTISQGAPAPMYPFFIGMIIIGVGSIIQNIGKRGMAGSGAVLDPAQARRDLEPYSRMAGGMIQDALEEASILPNKQAERVVLIKCRDCSALNEEDAKFCKQCGKPI
jgi:hypothetical protein